MWLLFTWVLKIPYRVKFSPLYQSCPCLTLNLVFQDQQKDKYKHIQCRSIVSSENECRRNNIKRKKKIEKVLFFSIEWVATFSQIKGRYNLKVVGPLRMLWVWLVDTLLFMAKSANWLPLLVLYCHISMFLPKKGFRPESEIPSRHPISSLAYIEKFLKLKYTVSMPEKISIS